jgi:hypothetical protein
MWVRNLCLRKSKAHANVTCSFGLPSLPPPQAGARKHFGLKGGVDSDEPNFTAAWTYKVPFIFTRWNLSLFHFLY